MLYLLLLFFCAAYLEVLGDRSVPCQAPESIAPDALECYVCGGIEATRKTDQDSCLSTSATDFKDYIGRYTCMECLVADCQSDYSHDRSLP